MIKFSHALEAKKIVRIICGFSLLFALVSFNLQDITQVNLHAYHKIMNWEGMIGAYSANWMFYLIGISSFVLPTHLIITTFIEVSPSLRTSRFLLQCLIIACLCCVFTLSIPLEKYPWAYNPGGIIGFNITWYGLQLLGMLGFTLLLICALTCSAILYFDKSLLITLSQLMTNIFNTLRFPLEKLSQLRSSKKSRLIKTRTQTRSTSKLQAKSGLLPKIQLLEVNADKHTGGPPRAQLQMLAKEIEGHLLDYNIRVRVVAIRPGPIVTRFELQPEAGTKASRISALSRDLARSLSVTSVRVVEVIPGKSVIGLELPNTKREVVRLREVLDSRNYLNSSSTLSLGLGKDIAGHPVVVDLAKMPHLLVAGTTGSGKSVGLNTMILSLVYKTKPEDLRLIMIDPKMLELAIYADIPHLLTPVVTDMKDAANALRWCVMEMERRYKLMANAGVRNIANYNMKVKSQKVQMNLLDEVAEKPLPYIVVIADEFADLIMVAGKKIEQLIARIAQKARAAGIHLILATQRPSVDVITGLIKANIPTRISFQVSSKIDSRTILDQGGAEQLLGYGDMLYLPPGTSVPIRIHGAFVEDEEVHRVVKHLKSSQKVEYIENITEDHEQIAQSADGDHGEKDALYDQAVQIVIESGKTSISYLQRRLRIGYNRSAVLIEQMEKSGILSSPESNGTRTLLVKTATT